MFKRNEKKTARQSTVAGLVFHGTISANTKGGGPIQLRDLQLENRANSGLAED